ncbi:iron-containing alcohol dehydrogenase family protein [Alkalihalobacillus sp. MEB130]|uniref:iron-containing alcohol dehydrogenase family protein n=1 Tax=Alkalihalobacillus sp. MEB130 TaxID=2976704 RepID=UPI0028E0606B|nr:iron-containing alcohol dehydrogenase family protein [Alkalihalobacillus sp. MEB130]MDT8859828.1 iron-containing alcohol dehydrogenase family protein [Alkalihalobacillus sp. MEB130]
MKEIRVQASPSYYACELGVYDRLESLLSEGRVARALFIHGKKSLKAASNILPTFDQLTVHFEPYGGECSLNEIERLQHLGQEKNCDVIIGLGGGKVMDVAKSVANEMNVPVVLLPTLASQCAAWTPLSVIYTDSGDYVKYTPFLKNPWIVLVDPRIIAASPAAFLRAGIGDTLAKWYEARALTKTLDHLRVPVRLSLQAAALCQELILEESEQAMQALGEKAVTQSLITIIETNIMAGGLVGGLGDHFGRIAAAHSIHNALTQFEETHHFLHGEKVAYGVLVQLALEEEVEELERLLPFFKRIGLPISLTDLGLEATTDVFEAIAQKTLHPSESIHFMSQSFTVNEVVHGIQTVETYKK